jgi:hypothetical protein
MPALASALVKALHWLAVYQARRGVSVTGQVLARYDSENILAAAQRHAFAARRDHYFRTCGPYEPRPLWVQEDHLLDAESEKKVLDEATYGNRRLFSQLEYERRRAGEDW